MVKKIIIYLEDNNQTKDKRVEFIEQSEFGVKIQLVDENDILVGVPFFLPWHRVLKIKELKEDDKDGNLQN